VRLYREIARRSFRRSATYRGATLAGIFTNTVFGFIKAYVLIALFAAGPSIGGYHLVDALTYSFVAQGLIVTVAIWGWFEIEERIRTGDIATDLLRPYSFLGYWLAYDVGRAAYQAVARGIPPFLVAGLAFDLRLPVGAGTWPLFVVSVALAVTVSFAIRAMVNLFALWFLDSRGVAGIVSTGWIFLSGLALPLATFPPWLRVLARLTPFAATFDAPGQIFLEQLPPAGIAATLGLQAGWAIVLFAAAQSVMNRGTRKLVIQGG
jgi:viologen exporter family transport system permease protein